MNFSDFAQLVKSTRSTRRYKPGKPITTADLRELVDLARQTPSAYNRQPLKYILVTDPKVRDDVFSTLSWAKALTEWGGPTEDQRPGAFIIILGDRNLSDAVLYDHSIAGQTMLLGARARGLAGCLLASADRDRLRPMLDIDDHLDILLILALGYQGEEITLEPLPSSGETKYWRDAQGGHHVPKRSLDDLIVKKF